MYDELKQLRKNNYKPVVYIERKYLEDSEFKQEIHALTSKYSIELYTERDVSVMQKISKLYVYRYGHIPQYTQACIIRKKGKIVSGNLK